LQSRAGGGLFRRIVIRAGGNKARTKEDAQSNKDSGFHKMVCLYPTFASMSEANLQPSSAVKRPFTSGNRFWGMTGDDRKFHVQKS